MSIPRPWSRPAWVAKTPILTTLLLEAANVSQLWRMWTERSAEGQSLAGWALVTAALLLWWNFYRVCTPDQIIARRACVVGIAFNLAVVATVTYFRFFAGVAGVA
jgi:hypothetical protein